ncbi:MAG: oxidoreductase [Ruminiclostridium sp.]
MRYKKLFSLIAIGNFTLRNRTAMAAMGCALAKEDGTVTDQIIQYYAERAKGGAGLIITEVVSVCYGHGIAARYQLSAAKDELIPGMTKMADKIHEYGAKIFFQLHHPGRQTFDHLLDGKPALSPSGIMCPVNKARTRPFTTDEIHQLVSDFGDAALRVKKSGIDGIEIHAAHGYVFHQFLSPHINKREDEYGGSFENRFRFLKEVVEDIRRKCGRDFPLCVRLSIVDFVEGSISLELGLQIAKATEDLGLVDIINASVGMYEGSISDMLESYSHPQGWRNDILRAVKKVVTKTPILAVNVVRAPSFAEWMLEQGMVDIVGIARPWLAEAEWAKKVEEGREKEIRPCVGCLYCNESTRGNVEDDAERNSCAINVRNCRETVYPEFNVNGNGRRVVVVGGGPAGMEAARVLSLRGFKVTLFESKDKLGGQLNIASKPNEKYRFDAFVTYFENQMNMLGVDVRLNTAATPENIQALNPVAVFVGTGSMPIVPNAMPGVNLPFVYTVPEILEEKVIPRNEHVAVIGSGMTGLETAEYLASRSNVITIVEMLDKIGKEVYFQNRDDVMSNLKKWAVNYLPYTKLLAIEEGGIRLQSLTDNKEFFVEVDEVVLSMGMKSDQTLLEELKDKLSCDVIALGDVEEVGRVQNAMYDAFTAAYKLLNS